ncbi:MAG: squalene/phytoene synthase family protein [Alphaproteobacteria bacterium]|nr:squalene/phytoene synthase family protein [Alphaproteobacteria bacterium]
MTSEIEVPSGKNESTENFPVTKLVSAKYRPHVAAFYIFARAADDISDDLLLSAEEKQQRLDRFDAALMDENDNEIASVIPLRNSLKETGVTPQHARDLLIAFKRDTTKLRYNNWEELIDYCRYSAAPVGRYLLDLHGEPKSSWPANDALCAILQITNHLQDCADDYRELDRVYIPLDIMDAFGTNPTALSAEKSTHSLRRTMDAMIDKMDPMMALAKTFPGQLNNRMLKIDTAVIYEVAGSLIKILRTRDPLCDNVKLSKAQKLGCLVWGTLKSYLG